MAAKKSPAHRFAESVCDMFEDDDGWSVLDLDGAAEFFKEIGFKPSKKATQTDEDDEGTDLVCVNCADITTTTDSPDGELCPDCYAQQELEGA